MRSLNKIPQYYSTSIFITARADLTDAVLLYSVDISRTTEPIEIKHTSCVKLNKQLRINNFIYLFKVEATNTPKQNFDITNFLYLCKYFTLLNLYEFTDSYSI